MNRRKELQNEFGMKKRAMGVYQIINRNNGKRFVGSSTTLDSVWKREEFMLQMGTHMNKALQAEWTQSGGVGFEFEVLAQLKLEDDIRHDYKDIILPNGAGLRSDVIQSYRNELKALEELWLEELQPFEPAGYNRRPRAR
ncbi:GIY-YIG nuclease family protein [Paenibacillus spongiae]|uniref:GIY-YIG nuclease family protein n=1 Tax=Paenibacillus spongiae TaxID=2909671 RepID=A0ABY5S4N7_9BACL|nr:GIY-YIG nuclease family protein [Paenibacillus spongiae]UVI28861.1 GIY-YIG nuclease family protein [Paenibacillus spongiae]